MAAVPRVIPCSTWSMHSPGGVTAHCHVTYRIRGRLQRKGVFSCRRTLTRPRIGYACAVNDCDSHLAAAWDAECLSDMTGWEALSITGKGTGPFPWMASRPPGRCRELAPEPAPSTKPGTSGTFQPAPATRKPSSDCAPGFGRVLPLANHFQVDVRSLSLCN